MLFQTSLSGFIHLFYFGGKKTPPPPRGLSSKLSSNLVPYPKFWLKAKHSSPQYG
jgi:hypothetical protein